MKSEAWSKVVGMGMVLALLVWGLGEIAQLVQERMGQRQTAVSSVAQSSAGDQTLIGPLVHRACTEEWEVRVPAEDKGRATVSSQRREFIQVAMPTRLVMDGVTQLEARGRGLHAAQVFKLQTAIKAEWNDLAALQAEREHAGSQLQCGPALLMMAVSDSRGIRQIELKVNGVAQPMRAGTFFGAYPRGVHAALAGSTDLGAPLVADIQLELLGTARLAVVPLGTATQWTLRSNWQHPSFNGQFLPVDHHIGDGGFDASWRVSALASTAQQEMLKVARRLPGGKAVEEGGALEALGVTFLDPTDTYALSYRATRYGMLFIGLTFAAVAMFEVLRRLRVHPMQYLLVGAAISVFFLLLVSLSEQMPFTQAYAVAAAGCVLLLTYYTSHILHSWRSGLPFGLGTATLYGLLYVLLRMEQKALAVGAVALFAVLALVMMLTRKVDWYAQLKVPGAP